MRLQRRLMRNRTNAILNTLEKQATAMTDNAKPNTVRATLEAAGIPVRNGGGGWLRIPAVWRGSSDFNLAVHAQKGIWFLHSTGESGSWNELVELMGLESDKPTYVAPVTGNALKEKRQRRGMARGLWDQAIPLELPEYRSPHPAMVRMQEAVTRYLRSRGIPEETQKRAAPHLRMAEEDDEAVLLLVPLYAPYPDQNKPAAVQRIRLDSQGRKNPWLSPSGEPDSEKRMLGTWKTEPDGAAAGLLLPPADLNRGGPVYLCEGPETALALMAMTREAVWCLASAGGLKAARIAWLWDHGFRHFRIAADNDRSQTGQKAAEFLQERILQQFPEARVEWACPEKEGEDWLDVLQACGVEQGAERLRLAMEKTTPPGPEEDGPRLRNWKKKDRPEVAQTVSLEQAHAGLRAAYAEALSDASMGDNRPHLVEVTTGVGKSRALAELVAKARKENLPVFVLTKTLELAREMAAEIGGVLHRGREFAPGEPNHCFQAGKGGLVEKLGNSRRYVQTLACKSCPHAARNEWDRIPDKEKPTLRQQVIKRFDKRPEDISPCEWETDNQRQKSVDVLVGAQGSLSDQTLYMQTENTSRIRWLIVDEETDLLDHWEIRLEQVAQWQTILHENKGARGDPIWQSKAEGLLVELGALLAASAGGGPLQPLRSDRWQTLVDDASRVQDDALPFERWDNSGKFQPIPLKVAEDLAWALQHGTALIDNGVLRGTSPNYLAKLLVGKHTPILFLTATPSPLLRDLVCSLGGNHTQIRATQNLLINDHPQRAHLRGQFQGPQGEVRLQQEKRRLELARNQTSRARVLTHKPLANPNMGDGYFGRDHIGHNRYAGQDLLLFGDPISPPDDLWQQYIGEAALARIGGVPEKLWPNWTPERKTGQWVDTGTHWVQARVSMPVDPQLQGWWLNRVEQIMLQSIGRLRATRSEQTLNVWRFGGVPIRWGHLGLQVEYREDQDGMGRSRQDWALQESADAMQRTQQAVLRLEKAGAPISRRTIQKEQRAAGEESIAPATYQRFLAWAKRHRETPGPEHLTQADLLRMRMILHRQIGDHTGIDWEAITPPAQDLPQVATALAKIETDPESIPDPTIRKSAEAWIHALRIWAQILEERKRQPA